MFNDNTVINLISLCITNSNFFLYKEGDNNSLRNIFTMGSVYFNEYCESIQIEQKSNVTDGPGIMYSSNRIMATQSFRNIILDCYIENSGTMSFKNYVILSSSGTYSYQETINGIICDFELTKYSISEGFRVYLFDKSINLSIESDDVYQLVNTFNSNYLTRQQEGFESYINRLKTKLEG